MSSAGPGASSGRIPSRVVSAAWLPGLAEVRVVGEKFHADALAAARRRADRGGELKGMLMPEPANPHDANAVAVYVEGLKVGHLPARVARSAQPALLAFAAAHDGQMVAGPAVIRPDETGPCVVLLLDVSAVGLDAELFDPVPEIDRVLSRMLGKLDLPAPVLAGCDQAARDMLAAAEAFRAEVDADYDRSAKSWPRAERSFRQVARQLETAGDPLVADAWVGVARSVRYQKGRRDDWIAAAVIALYWNRANADAWDELIELASSAPHLPTLLDLFGRVPPAARPRVLRRLIALSRGRDRLGHMSPEAGQQLRTQLTALARAQGDHASLTTLDRDARRHPHDH